MTAQPKTSACVARKLLLLFAFLMVSMFLFIAPPILSSARVQEERVFENTIPTHVPLKVKIKKEKEQSFKDLKNEKWVRELELEVTNTGNKPVYFFDMHLRTNVAPGIEVVFEDMNREGLLVLTVEYGRAELGDLIKQARSG